MLAAGSAAVGGTLAGCVDQYRALVSDENGDALSTIEVESSVSVAVMRWGLDQSVWEERDIDLAFDVEPFNQYNRQLNDELADIGAPSSVAQLEFMEDGEPLIFVGHQQHMFNRIFARADDDSIEGPADLVDKEIGLPAALSSTTSTAHRALIADEYGIDIVEDAADTRAADPPVLWELLQDGELDAISEFSGFTIRGIADDSVKTVFDPHELWLDRTGSGAPTTTFTVRKGWLDDNPDLVERFLDGWSAALSSFRENAETALDEYGMEAGITDPDEAAVVADLMADGVIFGPVYYDDDLVDAHWEFFELLMEFADVEFADPSGMFITREALQDL